MIEIASQLLPVLFRNQRVVASLGGLHPRDVVPLVIKHVASSKLVACSSRTLLAHFDEFTRPYALLKIFPDFPEGGLTHRAPERIAHQLAFIYHGLTLDIRVSGIGDGFAHARFSLLATAMLVHCTLEPDLPVARAHEITEGLEFRFRKEFPQISKVSIHAEPRERA